MHPRLVVEFCLVFFHKNATISYFFVVFLFFRLNFLQRTRFIVAVDVNRISPKLVQKRKHSINKKLIAYVLSAVHFAD